jgi:hypothetical protein
MADLPVICPKCQQEVLPHQIVFTRDRETFSLQKCPTCSYEWSFNSAKKAASKKDEPSEPNKR